MTHTQHSGFYDPDDSITRTPAQAQRLTNAQYWGAQAEHIMKQTNYGGPDGNWYVTVGAGDPIIVFNDDFWTSDQLTTVRRCLQEHNIPVLPSGWMDHSTNPRLVIDAGDDRLVSGDPHWRSWDVMPGFDWYRQPDGTITYPDSVDSSR